MSHHLVFGRDRDPYVARRRRPPLSVRGNPMIAIHGRDPEGRRCGDCGLLVPKSVGRRRIWYACLLRGKPTAGPGTDHLVSWPACAKFEPKGGEP